MPATMRSTLTLNQRRIMTEIACYDGYAEESQLPAMPRREATMHSLVERGLLTEGWNSDIRQSYWELTPEGKELAG